MDMNLLKTHEFEDSVFFRVPCGCGYPEHDVEMAFNLRTREGKFPDFTLDLTFKVYYTAFRFWERITKAFRILVTGTIEYEGDVILNEEQLDGFERAIRYAREKREKLAQS